MKKKICVFGGSKSGKDSENIKSAKIVGQIIAKNNFDIVFGGGENGIMGSVSETAIKHGCKTIGIIPNFLVKKDIQEKKHSKKYNTNFIITENMHQRKQMMYEKSDAFALYPSTDNKFFTYDELLKKIKKNQTDKDGKTIILYASNIEEQDSYIKEADKKGYSVLLLDSPIVSHLIQKLETSKEKISFARVDSDAIDNLIKKDEKSVSKLSEKEQQKLKEQIEEVIPKDKYSIQLEAMDSDSLPFMITQPEFMRRMKDMQNTGGNSMFGNMPEMYNLVVNTNNKLISEIFKTKTKNKRDRLIKQSLDLAKLSQNLLKGNDLTEFIKRSFDLIK